MTDAAPGAALSLEAGFARVDEQADPSFLLETMDQTSSWPAIVALRAFEADRLGLRPGSSLLDAGCGRGEVACALAAQVRPGGRVVGLDLSEAMLADARARAAAAGVVVDLRVGDVTAVDEPDGTFDAARAERVLQWVADGPASVTELVRVVRPGGRVSLIDTDWRTLAVDIADRDAADAVTASLVAERGDAARAGGLLVNWCRAAGLVDLETTAAVHTWTAWDPDHEPAPSGCFPLTTVVPQLVDQAGLAPDVCARFIDQLTAAARAGRFFMSLTMFGVVARKP